MNFIEGRCPGSKAMDFSNGDSSATLSNVIIGACDYTIAFWIRLFQPIASATAVIMGMSTSGDSIVIYLGVDSGLSVYVYVVVPENFPPESHTDDPVDMQNWTHIAIIPNCGDLSSGPVKMFINGVFVPILSYSGTDIIPASPIKTFRIGKWNGPRLHRFSGSIMDLHILGFVLDADEIFDLYKGQQFEMNFLSCEKMG